MIKVDKRSWERYARYQNLTPEELADEEYCEMLRGTVEFAFCRLFVACQIFGEDIFDALPECIKSLLGRARR